MFYGLCSKFGFGIFNDYNKAQNSKQWLKGSIIKGFDNVYGKRLIIPRVDCTLKIEYHMDDQFISDKF